MRNPMLSLLNEANDIIIACRGHVNDVLLERDLALSIIVNRDPELFKKCHMIDYTEDKYLFDTLDSKYFYLIYKTEKINSRFRIVSDLYYDFGCEEISITSDDQFDDISIKDVLTEISKETDDKIKDFVSGTYIPVTQDPCFLSEEEVDNFLVTGAKVCNILRFSSYPKELETMKEIIGDLNNLKFQLSAIADKNMKGEK